jgi:hypothetical protein
MSDKVSKAGPSNRSIALLLWVIGAIAPLYLFMESGIGKNDFVVFWIAGKQVLSGDAANIYNVAATGAYTQLFGLGEATIFPYPPIALFLFLPFALLPYLTAYLTWTVATSAFFYWCAKPHFRDGLPPILSIMTPAAISCLAFGQTGLLFGGLWLLAFQGKWAAVALMTFKPHLGLLSILSLRSRRALLNAVIMVVMLLLVSVLLFGPTLWQAFVEHSVEHAAKITTMKRWQFAGVAPAFGYGFWGWIPFAAAGALLLVRNINVFTAATASFLISPYGFNYDMPVVCVGFGLAIFGHWRDMPVRHRIPMAIGFLSPAIAMSGTWWIPPLLLWALWVQVQYDTFDGELRNRQMRWEGPTAP